MKWLSANRQYVLMVLGLAVAAYVVNAVLVEPIASAAERERGAAVSRLKRANASAGDFFTEHAVGTDDAWWRDNERRAPKHPAERAAELRAMRETLSEEVAALTERVAYTPAPRFRLPEDFAAHVRQQVDRAPEPGDYQRFADAVRDRELRTPMGESPAYRFIQMPLGSATIEGSDRGFNFGTYTETLPMPDGDDDEATHLRAARERARMRLTLLNIAVNLIEAARGARVAEVSQLSFTPPGSVESRYKSDTSRRYRPYVVRVALTTDESGLLAFLVACLRPEQQGHAGQALTLEHFQMEAPDALSDTPGADLVTATMTFVAMLIDPDAPFVSPSPDARDQRSRPQVRRRGFW